jgi:hypothetical protein
LLAVDSAVGAATVQWLEKYGAVVGDGDFRKETQRGFQVIPIRSDSMSLKLLAKLEQQGMATVTVDPGIYQRLISKIPVPQETSEVKVAGVNIARNSIDPLGQRIAALLRKNYASDRSLEDIAKMTLEKNPELMRAIDANGGSAWLDKCQHQGRADLSGQGRQSPLIQALATAYEGMTTSTQITAKVQEPVDSLAPKVMEKSQVAIKAKPKKARTLSV